MAIYAQTTLEELRDQLTDKLGANSTFWTTQEKNDAINEALRIWQALTMEFTDSFVLNAQEEEYVDVPRQVVMTQRLLFNGTPVPMISLWELDGAFSTWQSETGATPLYWAPVGLNKIALYPTPNDGGFLRFEGVAETPKVLGDGDFIPLGEEELERIVDYAHHYCTFKEGSTELESSQMSFVRMIEAAGLRNSRLKASAFYKFFMGLGRDDDERSPRKEGGLGRS